MKLRFQEVEKRIDILQAMPHDLRTKCHLVKSAIFPKFIFGTELVPLGRSHTDKLRSKIVDAILGNSISRNSAIAFLCLPKILDPELEVLHHAISAARRFLQRAPADAAQQFLNIAACHSGLHSECRGPASVLKYYLLRLGWTIDKTGNILVGQFLKLSLLSDSMQSFKKFMVQSWQHDLLQRFSDRKSLIGLPAISRCDTTQILAQFTPKEQKQLINEIAAAYQTAQQQSAWDTSTAPDCKFCQQLDTKHHRVHTCPAVQEIREPFQPDLDWLEQIVSMAHELPVIHVHENADWLQTCLYTFHEPDLEPMVFQQLQGIDMNGTMLNFYCDGSCMHPANITTRFAAYAVVLDSCHHLQEREYHAQQFKLSGIMPPSLTVLMATRLQGDQRIHRAELAAILYIYERFSNTNIHTDSTVALSVALRCIQGEPIINFQGDADFDLVIRLWPCLQYGKRQFFKVKAHRENEQTDAITMYHRLGNKRANDAAILACKNFCPELVNDLQQMHEEVNNHRYHIRNLFKFYLESHQHRAKLDSNVPAVDESTTMPHSRQAVLEKIKSYQVADPWKRLPLPMHQLQYCAWGDTFAKAMLVWMDAVKWPKMEALVDQQDIGISWAELAISFMLHSNLYFPVKRKDNQGTEHLFTPSSLAEAQANHIKLSEVAHLFAIFSSR